MNTYQDWGEVVILARHEGKGVEQTHSLAIKQKKRENIQATLYITIHRSASDKRTAQRRLIKQ